MGLSVLGRNNLLNCGIRLQTPTISITHAALFTADPDGTLGTSYEVTGGTPAYSRETIAFNAASGGQITHSSQPAFDVPPGTTVTHVGFFSADTGGTYFGMASVTSENFGNQGTYTLTATTISLT